MAGTAVPPVTFGPNGFQVPSGPAVLAGVQADISAAFGRTLNFAFSTPQGQLASSEAAIIDNTNSIFVYYTNQVDPAFATGRMQDAIARIYFLERLPSEPTVLQIACVGLQGVNIPVGTTVTDGAGNIYQCTELGVIPSSNTITLPFAALVPGPTAVPEAVSIYQAIPGWDTATVVSGVVGQNVETRAQFEARRAASVAQNSVGSLPSILGAVLSVSGVLDAYVTENATNAPISVGGTTLAANSLYVAAVGGAAADVAQAIWTKKAPGCSYNGNTTVVVTDNNSGYTPPFPTYNVTFEIPPSLAVLFAVSIANSPQVPANAATLIQNAILSAFAGGDGGPRARIGSKIYASRFYAPVAALGPWVQIISILVGSNNSSGAVFSGTIAGTTLTVPLLISGTIAVGQTITDVNGDIAIGTTILSQLTGTPGGAGTYSVSISQTVAGASFTGAGSGTNLTASAVTGVIEIGNVIAGSGIAPGTTILSQTSGTPGGAGVYVTSLSTTVAGATTAAKGVTAAVASLQDFQVNINQSPTLNPANIVVTVT